MGINVNMILNINMFFQYIIQHCDMRFDCRIFFTNGTKYDNTIINGFKSILTNCLAYFYSCVIFIQTYFLRKIAAPTIY